MSNTIVANCPKCKKSAKGKDEIDNLFGWRKVNNKTVPQSQCYDCRFPIKKK